MYIDANHSEYIMNAHPSKLYDNQTRGRMVGNFTGFFLSDVEFSARYGIHRMTIWRWLKTDPKFPKPIKLSPRCTRWKLEDILAWEQAK